MTSATPGADLFGSPGLNETPVFNNQLGFAFLADLYNRCSFQKPTRVRLGGNQPIDVLPIDNLCLCAMAKKPDWLPGTLDMLILKNPDSDATARRAAQEA